MTFLVIIDLNLISTFLVIFVPDFAVEEFSVIGVCPMHQQGCGKNVGFSCFDLFQLIQQQVGGLPSNTIAAGQIQRPPRTDRLQRSCAPDLPQKLSN